MAKLPLTIDVKPSSRPVGTQDQWTILPHGFINDIETPQLAKGANIGQLVSGIPSAFARVDLFRTALEYSSSAATDHSAPGNLVSYYQALVQEWRGFIACIALDYAHISVRSVDLRYSDGKDIKDTKNVYEPKGAFGNMLLKREPRWCEQGLTRDQIATPYINIIKYRGSVVGATSPESLLFTSTGYKAEHAADRPWIDNVTGKFIDPLDGKMTESQFVSLHAYVSHLLKSIDKLEGYFSDLPSELAIDYKSIRNVLEKWKGEIVTKALETSSAIDFTLGSTPPVSADFRGPFKDLFCYEDILWGLEGQIFESSLTSAIKFDPKKVLLDEKNAKIVQLGLNIEPHELEKLPILVLSAAIKGSIRNEKAYFALPLSAQGLDVFGKNIAALVGMAGTHVPIDSTLSAVYDPNARTNNLEICLTLKTTTGAKREYKKIYTSDSQIKNKDILIWPNFISPQWDAYYMYSELPHSGRTGDYQAYPFVGTMQDNYFRILTDDDRQPLFLSKDNKIVAPANVVDAELLVKTDDSVASNPYKYEIYKSNQPFKGVCFKSPVGADGGYILVNYSAEQGSDLPRDMMRSTPALTEVALGVDFGSTNTSIAYSTNLTEGIGFKFKNHRVSLMGYELPGRQIIPRENQVFFFQGYGCEIQSNSIKSVLTLHDSSRLPDLQLGYDRKMRDEKAVIGGFPSFSDNLPFQSSTSSRITLNFPNGVGQVTQVHNMKWEDTDEAKAHKSAFLRTLMLHVYATLFEQAHVPTSLRWSYPSAMRGSLLNSYQLIWNGLKGLSPVLTPSHERYSLEISEPIKDGDGFDGRVVSGFGSADDSSNGFGGSSSADSFGSFGGFEASNTDGFGASGAAGFGSSSSDFGSVDGFGESRVTSSVNTVDLRPDSTDGEIKFAPKPLLGAGAVVKEVSLSEAESVANHISVKYATQANELNLCFDVGGSTTDISALFLLRGETGKNAITMVKQNSIRFAAQRISQSIGNFTEFENVLKEICAKYGISMVGLNMGPSSYKKDTAPYFFDQIVNRLNTEQLKTLYGLIAANCPNLMVLNMYVTGLLMFYAGQLSHKLVDDLIRTSDSEWPAKKRPLVRVTFAGKGARLFQWVSSVNSAGADQYYRQMFILGYGDDHMRKTLIDYPHIALPTLNDPYVKYEVSMGLAKSNTDLQRPSIDQPAEIIGESGWQVVGNDMQPRKVAFTNSITPNMMSRIGIEFRNDGNSTKFTEFCGLFYAAAQKLFGWSANPAALKAACDSLSPVRYAQNMPEFITSKNESARTGSQFSFVAPIIIIEGMQFYDESLLNHL